MSTLHVTTKATSTGLGKLHASTAADEELWMPDSQPWNPKDAGQGSHLPATRIPSAAVALAIEIERAAHLRALRTQFRAECRLSAPPMHAMERWILLCRWHVAQGSSNGYEEPLLPVISSSAADAGLADDLLRAGLASTDAHALIASLRTSAAAAATALKTMLDAMSTTAAGSAPPPRVRLTRVADGMVHLAVPAPSTWSWKAAEEDADEDQVAQEAAASSQGPEDKATGADASSDDSSDGDHHEGGEGGCGTANAPAASSEADVCAEMTSGCLEKLRVLYGRQLPTADPQPEGEADFRRRVLACLLRYRAVGGLGFQAALGGKVFVALQAILGCNFEVFASPLNCYYGSYCSAFRDVDGCFGSRGSFSDFTPARGSYQVNPPFVAAVIDAAAAHILALLEAAEAASEALAFAVVLPGWTDCRGYASLLSADAFLKRSLLLPAEDHGFVDGGQHARPRSYRESPYDTRLFVLQTTAAAARWTVAGETGESRMRAIEVAFAACTPSAKELEGVESAERVHRHGGARKKGRRKMKRAGKKTKAWQQQGSGRAPQ